MKYVAVLDEKNTASFLIGSFRDVMTGQSPASESCEGITFFRAIEFDLVDQLKYFSEIHKLLLQKYGRGLDAAVIPGIGLNQRHEFIPFCEGMKKISPAVKTICICPENAIWEHSSLDDFILGDFQSAKGKLKLSLGLDVDYDDKRKWANNPLSDVARKIYDDLEPF